MEQEEYTKMFELEDAHWWFRGRNNLVKSFVMKIKNKDKILDIGCGTGANLKNLANLGEMHGCDLSHEALKFCRQRGSKNLVLADAAKLPFKKESFDVVIATDIIEHIDDDVSALKEIKRVIKKGGHVIINVPAFKFLWSKHDDLLHHKRRYTLKELKSKLRGAGFRIKKVTYWNAFLFVPIILYKLVNKDKSHIEKSHQLINSILFNTIRFESIFTKHLNWPIGTSVFCVARKSNQFHKQK